MQFIYQMKLTGFPYKLEVLNVKSEEEEKLLKDRVGEMYDQICLLVIEVEKKKTRLIDMHIEEFVHSF